MNRVPWKQRIASLRRTWITRKFEGKLYAWKDYWVDNEGHVTGKRIELVGRKYQQLQGKRTIGDWEDVE